MIASLLLLAAVGVAHHGKITARLDNHLPAQYFYVYVRDCDDRFIPIYMDQRLTIPIANPFLADTEGTWIYYSTVRKEKETVEWAGALIETDSCNKRKEAK